MNSHSIIDSIKEKLDIVDVVTDYIPNLRKAGRNHKACCPFHNEKTPSFTVSQDKQMYYCFGCNEHGDMFKFVMSMDGITFVEALKKLAKKAGLEWAETEYHQLSEKEKERLAIKKVLAAAEEFYKKLLFSSNGEKARLYLGARKISKATVEKFCMGFAPQGEPALLQELERKGFSKELPVKAGLAALRDNGQAADYFRNRVMFPIKNPAGETIAFGGRALEDGQQPKYLNSPETPLFAKRRTLYGMHEALPGIRKGGRLLILEGYMDVISAHQHGVNYAVAPLGTALSPEHAAFIKRYSRDTILMFDADEAGINASLRASDIFMEAGMYVKVADLGEELDPDEYLNKYGVEAFEKKLQSAADPLEFRIATILKNRPGPISSQDKARLVELLLDTVARQTDEVLKSEWIKTLAARFDVKQESVLRQLNKKTGAAGKPSRSAAGEPSPAAGQQDVPAIELGFIQLILKAPALIACAPELSEEDFQSPFSKKIFSAVRDGAAAGPAGAMPGLLERFPESAALIMKLSVEDIGADVHPEQNAAGAAAMIKKLSQERRWKALKGRLGALEPAEVEEFRRLTGALKAAPKKTAA